MNKETRLKASVNQKLTEMGERERLKELLRAKLTECGWKDQMKAHCKDVIKEKGLEHVTVEDLVAEITPKGRGNSPLFQKSKKDFEYLIRFPSFAAMVPDSVKKELLHRIRAFLSQHAS
ncbi:hypothetical protein NL108_000030 [Boleophthalmus pectinirostris]|nr:hypothetical protein NL108_000030 [Boleophthalmus pectinirostris]